MYAKIAPIVFGLAAVTTAAPVADWGFGPPQDGPPGGPPSGPPGSPPSGPPGGPPGSPPTYTQTAPSAAQTPFKFPLSNGFPNIQIPSNALLQIEQQAHGTLPNTPLPKAIADSDATSFEVIAFGETFEVAFFTSLFRNITNHVPGFNEEDIGGDMSLVIDALEAIIAQEELHALGANAILATAGRTTIQPCEYIFPSSDFNSAIRFISTVTDVVLGTLQDVQSGLALNNDAELIPLIGSIIGQEGEQNGAFRVLLDLIPSQLPFLTRSAGPFAFSALNQAVIVKGSCPNINIIQVPIFAPLVVATTDISSRTTSISFSFTNNGQDVSSLSLVYINQQNLPVVEKLQNVSINGNTVTFDASFPYAQNLMNGLTIAAVTSSAGPFTSADDVAAKTIFGPGLIEVD